MGIIGVVGRVLLGLFFLLPGLMKAMDPAQGLELMVARDVPFHVPLFWASLFLIKTIFNIFFKFAIHILVKLCPSCPCPLCPTCILSIFLHMQ